MQEPFVSILNATPLPQIAVDSKERIVAANPPALALLGAGILSRHYVTALRQPALLDCIESVVSGRTATAEAQYLSKDISKESTYRVTVARIDLDRGHASLVTFIDTTDLQEAGQMRRDFVANVSHELRTPLTALMGFIETLRGAAREDPDARDRFLEIMEREAGRMNRLVKDLLSLSRVESEERVRPQDSVDLSAIARSVVSSINPLSEEASAEITLVGADRPVPLRGDADQLSQVLSNLVENAIKYGGTGTRVAVEIETSEHDASVRGPAVLLTVTDDGEGFDPVHIPRVTERFYRVDNHRSREMGGTGLGLAIVKHIVNRHRGRLRIESAPGLGSRFSITLPEA